MAFYLAAVVMKVVAEELAGSMSLERFRQEIRLAAALQHPHIVPVLSAGEADEVLYYTMPLVEGESVRARLDRDGAFPLDRAITVLRDVASALEYAHAKGVVHRTTGLTCTPLAVFPARCSPANHPLPAARR